MPEPPLSVGRYGGIYSMTKVPVPWWHWWALLHPRRARRARRAFEARRLADAARAGDDDAVQKIFDGSLDARLRVNEVTEADERYRNPKMDGLAAETRLLAPRPEKGTLSEAVAAVRGSGKPLPTHACCGGVKALGHEPGCEDDIRRRAASGRYDD